MNFWDWFDSLNLGWLVLPVTILGTIYLIACGINHIIYKMKHKRHFNKQDPNPKVYRSNFEGFESNERMDILEEYEKENRESGCSVPRTKFVKEFLDEKDN